MRIPDVSGARCALDEMRRTKTGVIAALGCSMQSPGTLTVLHPAALRVVLFYLRAARGAFVSAPCGDPQDPERVRRIALMYAAEERLARAIGPTDPTVRLGERHVSSRSTRLWTRTVDVDGFRIYIHVESGAPYIGRAYDGHARSLWSGRVAKSTGAKGILRYAGFLERGV